MSKPRINSLKLSVAAALAALAASLIASPATAYADCGDPDQAPCTGPVPTVDEVVGIMQQLTDPNIPSMSKGNIVAPGFTPDEAGTIDDRLHRTSAFGYLPYDFVVADIEPAPANQAGATVTTTGGYRHRTGPAPIVLVNQGGHWLITHDTAMTELDLLWSATQRHIYVG